MSAWIKKILKIRIAQKDLDIDKKAFRILYRDFNQLWNDCGMDTERKLELLEHLEHWMEEAKNEPEDIG